MSSQTLEAIKPDNHWWGYFKGIPTLGWGREERTLGGLRFSDTVIFQAAV